MILQVRISSPFQLAIRAGRRRPHPGHRQALAELVGISDGEKGTMTQ